MNFNTLTFLSFFASIYALYVIPSSWNHKKNLLLCASYLFYGWWNVYYLSLIILSTIIDYQCGKSIEKSVHLPRRKRMLAISVISNISILCIFKYFNFFSENAVLVLNTLGMEADYFTLNVLLPVGISFYTFQSMSYTIDIYRKEIKPVNSLRDFALFVGFFPQLVAGPIVRAKNFIPQLLSPRKITFDDIETGISWIIIGYFFKVGVADNLASSVDMVFSGTGHIHPLEAWLATTYFSFQIFGDFFGYTLIARGVAKLMGFDIPENFKQPYLARGFSDFWRRWHISLSSWLRDYLYIPLGGNKYGRTYRNLMLTMLLGGLWHGASWVFITWGFIHGIYLIAERKIVVRLSSAGPFGQFMLGNSIVADLVKILFTYLLVLFSWAIFRSENLSQAISICSSMLNLYGLFPIGMPNKQILKDGVWLIPVLLYHLWHFRNDRYNAKFRVPATLRMAGLAILAFVTITCREASDAFIYFQF